MFKKDKDMTERSRALLKNKETKKLKTDILSKFPLLTEGDLDGIILKDQFTRIVLASRTVVYSVASVPYFIDHEGRNNFFPTPFLLWRCPHALRSFVIHAPVSAYVMKGADLMVPGLATLSGLEGMTKGEKMSVRVWGNPAPFAVGCSAVSWETIVLGGRKGKALAVNILYGDFLCPLKGVGCAVPNGGFGASSIYSLEGHVEADTDADSGEESDEESDEGEGEGCAGFAGGEGKFSYKSALKSKSKSKSKQGVRVKEIEGSEDFPALGVRVGASASGSVSSAGGVCGLETAVKQHDVRDEVQEEGVVSDDWEDSKTVEAGVDRDDIEGTGDEPDKREGDEDHDSVVEEREGEEDEEDAEDDISRYQREIEEQHRVKEGLKAVPSAPPTALASVASVDAMLVQALLKAVKYVIRDKQLPMLVSAFWNIIQKCITIEGEREEDRDKDTDKEGEKEMEGEGRVDIKLSSFKKVYYFLETNGVASVTAVQRTHDLFRGVKVQDPESLRMGVKSTGREEDKKGRDIGKVSILELYKLPKNIREIFGEVKGQHGEHLRASEVRDLLVMYLKNNGLEMHALSPAPTVAGGDGRPVRVDKSCVSVPPTDPLYSLACTVSSTSTSNTTVKDAKKTKDAQGASKEDSASSLKSDLDRMRISDREREEIEEFEEGAKAAEAETGQSVGGVWMPKIGGGGAWGTAATAHSSSGSGGRAGSSSAPVGAFKAGEQGQTADRTVRGGSSVGGWGFDKGTAWHPVSLPPSVPTPLGGKGAGAGAAVGKKSTDRMSAEAIQKKQKEKKAEKALVAETRIAEKETALPVSVRKEDLMKTLLLRLTPYFAVVSPEGSVSISSGQLPRIEISVEMRKGNKVVTHIRGLEMFGIDLVTLTKDFQKKFASSASVSLIPGMVKDREIIIQGHLAYEVELFLTGTYDIPQHLVQSKVLKGVKPKKK